MKEEKLMKDIKTFEKQNFKKVSYWIKFNGDKKLFLMIFLMIQLSILAGNKLIIGIAIGYILTHFLYDKIILNSLLHSLNKNFDKS